MQSAISITLVVALAVPALPAMAWEHAEARGPIAQGVAREATRLAIAPQGSADAAEWLRVRNLASGTEVIITVRGSEPVKRYAIRADDVTLLLSRTFDDAIREAVKPTIQASPGRDTIERIARTDVAQIVVKTTERTKRSATAGALLGLAGGIALGSWSARHVECPGTQEGSCMMTDLLLLPALISAAGAVAGYYALGHTTKHVIYQAP